MEEAVSCHVYFVEVQRPYVDLVPSDDWIPLNRNDDVATTARFLVLVPTTLKPVPKMEWPGISRACLLLDSIETPLPLLLRAIEESGFSGFSCWRANGGYTGTLIQGDGVNLPASRPNMKTTSHWLTLRWLAEYAVETAKRLRGDK